MRILSLEPYMREALKEAQQALSGGEVPVGALIVRNGEIIVRAQNRVERENRATAHAELLAIDAASAALRERRLEDCTLFSTLEPCAMCMGAIVNARIGCLVFGAFDREFGAAGSAIDAGLLSGKLRVVGGICQDECEALIGACFKEARAR